MSRRVVLEVCVHVPAKLLSSSLWNIKLLLRYKCSLCELGLKHFLGLSIVLLIHQTRLGGLLCDHSEVLGVEVEVLLEDSSVSFLFHSLTPASVDLHLVHGVTFVLQVHYQIKFNYYF